MRAEEVILEALALDPDNDEIKQEEIIIRKEASTSYLKANGDAHTSAGKYLLEAKLDVLALTRDPNDVHARADITELLEQAADKVALADMQIFSAKPKLTSYPQVAPQTDVLRGWKKSPSLFGGWQARWFVFHPSQSLILQ